MKDIMRDELGAPKIADRNAFQAEMDALLVREKAHTREGNVIAAARRRLRFVPCDFIGRSLPALFELGPPTSMFEP